MNLDNEITKRYVRIYKVGTIYYFIGYNGNTDISCTHAGFGRGICVTCATTVPFLTYEKEMEQAVERKEGERIK